ncbi:hypothetical protein BKA70DRAFT_1428088 [Coprinopsis sp. MPI-PUGE-AT-0042]|nr:hypothetical protein BKA70DRAFT_1428088 [Coprinopsis sp. MPI-PUGE-AT-0042]
MTEKRARPLDRESQQGAPLETAHFPVIASPPTGNSTTTVTVVLYEKNYRSTLNILWSCLSVIFACTWTALHPNVYGFQSTQWQRTKRRALLFLLSLLMPEITLVWSIKQWLGARDITRVMNGGILRPPKVVISPFRKAKWPKSFPSPAKERLDWGAVLSSMRDALRWVTRVPSWCFSGHKSSPPDGTDESPRWTDVHSHFLQMGGYIFQFGDAFSYVEVADLLGCPRPESQQSSTACSGPILFTCPEGTSPAYEPDPSDVARNLGPTPQCSVTHEVMKLALLLRQDQKDEIMDKSKSNGFARAIAYTQMLWFGLQRFISLRLDD